MKRVKFFLLLLAVPVFFLTSCKKDEPEPDPFTYKSPTSASRTTVVDIPAGLTAKAETDPYASIAVAYIGLANAIGGFASSFTVPSNAQEQNKKSSSKVYYWGYSGFSYWMTYS